MALVQGPFDVRYGNATLLDVSEISLDFEQDSSDYTTIDNRRYTIDGAISASVTLTFLKSDVPALAVVLSQYYKASGQTLSSGETVTGTEGAIDVMAASCDTDPIYEDLDIISCGTNGHVFRLKNARTKIDSAEFADNSVRTVSVIFIGEPEAGVASIQLFRENDVTSVS
jgi:hypothetical protein